MGGDERDAREHEERERRHSNERRTGWRGPKGERPTEQDGYVAAPDEAKTAERTEADDRAAD